MFQVTSNVWIGDQRDALSDRPTDKVHAVLNCTSDIPFSPRTIHMPRARLAVEDDGDKSQMAIMARELPRAVAWMQRTVASFPSSSSHHRLLVHCRMGRQRSACVVAAYLMKTEGLSPAQAVERLRSVKADAFYPEPNFWSSLLDFHTRLCRQ